MQSGGPHMCEDRRFSGESVQKGGRPAAGNRLYRIRGMWYNIPKGL